MKLNRFFKIIFLSEFIKGIVIAFREILKKKKKPLIIHMKKDLLAQDQEENML